MGEVAENLELLELPDVGGKEYVAPVLLTSMLKASETFSADLEKAYDQLSKVAADTSLQALCARVSAYYLRDSIKELHLHCVLDMCAEPGIFVWVDNEHISRRRFVEAISESVYEFLHTERKIPVEYAAQVAWSYSSPIEVLTASIEHAVQRAHPIAEPLCKSLYLLVERHFGLGERLKNTASMRGYTGLFSIIKPLARAISIRERNDLLIRLTHSLRERCHDKNRWIEFASALDQVMQKEGLSHLEEAYFRGKAASDRYARYVTELSEVHGEAEKEDAMFVAYCNELGVALSQVLGNSCRIFQSSKSRKDITEAIEVAYEETASIFSLMLLAGSTIYDAATLRNMVLSIVSKIGKKDLEENMQARLLMLLVPAAYFSFDEALLLCESREAEGSELSKKWQMYSHVLSSFAQSLAEAVSDKAFQGTFDPVLKRYFLMKFDSPLRSHLGFGISQYSLVLSDLEINEDAVVRFEGLEYSALANTWVLFKEFYYHCNRFNLTA